MVVGAEVDVLAIGVVLDEGVQHLDGVDAVVHAAKNILDGLLLAGGVQTLPDGVRHTHTMLVGTIRSYRLALPLSFLAVLFILLI